MPLPRIPEPELMDTAEDAEEYDAMDFSEANTRFAEDALLLVAQMREVSAIDLGTGTAQIPILMLERRPDLSILAVDAAAEMLKVGTRNVTQAGFGGQITLARMDVKKLRVEAQRFDLVLCNSTIHHIPEPIMAFREIARIAKPSAAIVVRDLIRPDSFEEAWGIVKRVAAGETAKQQQLFFDSLCAALTLEEVTTLARDAGLSRLRVERCSDRHWTAERGPLLSLRPPPPA
jgi:ubiquinone/menaquinone biosynthesis C-methylase UbiE